MSSSSKNITIGCLRNLILIQLGAVSIIIIKNTLIGTQCFDDSSPSFSDFILVYSFLLLVLILDLAKAVVSIALIVTSNTLINRFSQNPISIQASLEAQQISELISENEQGLERFSLFSRENKIQRRVYSKLLAEIDEKGNLFYYFLNFLNLALIYCWKMKGFDEISPSLFKSLLISAAALNLKNLAILLCGLYVLISELFATCCNNNSNNKKQNFQKQNSTFNRDIQSTTEYNVDNGNTSISMNSNRRNTYKDQETEKQIKNALNFNGEIECTICLEEISIGSNGETRVQSNNLQYLPCQHIFHQNCIDKWFQKNIQCPNCRKQYQIV